MNNSKRQFLKFITWSAVLIPVAAHARFTPFKNPVPRVKEVPQVEVGGGMTGVDFSRYYKPTK
jgi:hypothetical protein